MGVVEDARRFQREVEALYIDALTSLVAEYRAALPALIARAEAAAQRIAAMRAAGETPTALQVAAATQAREVARAVALEAQRLADALGPLLTTGQQTAMAQGVGAAEAIVNAALPGSAGLTSYGYTWQQPPFSAVEAFLGAAQGETLGALLQSFGPDIERRVRGALVSGLLAGKNPRAVARTVRDVAAMAPHRAEVISRTEMLRAFRAATAASYEANREVVPRFRRLAAKSARTCAACLALDGQEQNTGELLATHPQDRCTVVPVVDYARLGLNIRQPVRETGAEWLTRQPADVQRAVLGSQRAYDAYRSGTPLQRFARVEDSEWGPSLRVRPVREVA